MTRSQTKAKATSTLNIDQDQLAEILENVAIIRTSIDPKNPKSAISKHYLHTGHVFTEDSFRIIHEEKHKYKLLIKEALLIHRQNPDLNQNVRSMPLYIYPDGLNVPKHIKQTGKVTPIKLFHL